MSWCTIESDPGVFTELISKIGVEDIQVEEMHDLDQFGDDKIYGLIFLFKYDKKFQNESAKPCHNSTLWFAKQVIVNACATQALLNLLMNAEGVNLGDELTRIKEFTQGLSPEMRGETLGSSEKLRESHNAFARPEPITETADNVPKDEEQDAFHFVAYIAVEGKIYELDGLQPAPLDCGDYDKTKPEEAKTVMKKVLAARMEQYQKVSTELRFTLMKVVKNRQTCFKEQIKDLEAKSANASADEKKALQEQISTLQIRCEEEKAKFEKWSYENTRRKHNYIPMILTYLKQLQKKGMLTDLAVEGLQKAKKRKMLHDKKKKEAAEKKTST